MKVGWDGVCKAEGKDLMMVACVVLLGVGRMT
jgi:hypothetical protein